MHPVLKSDIQRALVNVSKSERAAVTFEPAFDDVPWGRLDFYGWRDSRFPRRGYLVRQHDDGLVAVAVHTPESGMSGARKAMCVVCRAVDTANSIALFAARRTGAAGRKGDTVGTYICVGLDCSAQLRLPRVKVGRSMLSDTELDPDVLAVGMLERLDGFLASVQG
jgi:hypothetical protein